VTSTSFVSQKKRTIEEHKGTGSLLIAFTGTPLIVRRGQRQLTHERFGSYIDKYKVQDAVKHMGTGSLLTFVRRPEEYRWCSLGYHLQSANAGDLLSLEFGLADWNELDQQEAVRKYREFIYETGAVDAGKGAVIEQGIVERERRRKYRVGRAERFLQRSRYFTDSGIIGSPVKSCLRQGAYGSFHKAGKEFVGEAPVTWQKFYGVNLRPGQAHAAVQRRAQVYPVECREAALLIAGFNRVHSSGRNRRGVFHEAAAG
jgi:hypothetical protein